jgi:serine/threonine protein kinase
MIANLDIKKYENNSYLTIINTVENIIYSENILITNIELFLELINKCKKNITIQDNELEKILYKIDNNIYDYIFFLNNSNNLMIDNEKINIFLSKLNYIKKNFKEIDKLNLKRGFIQGLSKDNKNYLLKYQPNKSVMELVLNCYMNVIKSNNFLIPNMFFINSDNSYFYIIQKYNTDLHKYFNILEENNKILKFNDIINIISFIINSIEILHENNIIHCDLKLENIVINIDKNLNIKEIKIIDFDVGLFNNVPKELSGVTEKYQKIFNRPADIISRF